MLELSQTLLADPEREGLQLLARDDAGRVVGFATLFWSWQTLAACLERCREHGATREDRWLDYSLPVEPRPPI